MKWKLGLQGFVGLQACKEGFAGSVTVSRDLVSLLSNRGYGASDRDTWA